MDFGARKARAEAEVARARQGRGASRATGAEALLEDKEEGF